LDRIQENKKKWKAMKAWLFSCDVLKYFYNIFFKKVDFTSSTYKHLIINC